MKHVGYLFSIENVLSRAGHLHHKIWISICCCPMQLNCRMCEEQQTLLTRYGKARLGSQPCHVTELDKNPPFDPNTHITREHEEDDIVISHLTSRMWKYIYFLLFTKCHKIYIKTCILMIFINSYINWCYWALCTYQIS
jgi:hypothetical protein